MIGEEEGEKVKEGKNVEMKERRRVREEEEIMRGMYWRREDDKRRGRREDEGKRDVEMEERR